jgi:hypothetical protein
MSAEEAHLFDGEIDRNFPREGLLLKWPDGALVPGGKRLMGLHLGV